MFKSKTLKAIALSSVMAIAMVGCASEPDDGSTDIDSGTADGGSDDTPTELVEGNDLVIGVLGDAVSMDPHGSNDVPSSNVQTNIFETLVKHDEDMNLQPHLATEWEAIEDTIWEFTLREDVTFHDGSDFNAEVVKANIDRILDEDVASPRAFLFDSVEEVVVTDEYTVQFHTSYPFAPLPSHLAHNGGGMISLDAIEADYEAMANGEQPGHFIGENPIGSGFFKYEEWVTGDKVVLTKNEDYWGEPAKVDSVTFKVIPEDLTRVGELESGTAHIIHPVNPSDKNRVNNNEGTHVDETESLSLTYIGFNLQSEPFDNKLVRQAVSMAINKDDIIEGVMQGEATPAVGPIGENVFGYSDQVEPLPYDIERAQELLAEAGYEDGFSTTIWTNDNRTRQEIAELVQAQLTMISIDAEIEVLEFGAYLDSTAEGNHDMFVLGWSTATGDADYGMHALFHSDNHGSAGNRTFLANDEVDELLDLGRQEADLDARADIYERAMEILVEEAPMLYLYHQSYLVGVNDQIEGFWKHPNGLYQLQDVSINQ